MAIHPRAFVVAALAAIAVAGIALGAESQKETFLHPEALKEAGLRDAAGNLVTFTALIPATAIAAAAAISARSPLIRRPLQIGVVWICSYALVWILQSAIANYDALQEQRVAAFSITPLITNTGEAVGSIYLGPLALLLSLAIGLYMALRGLLQKAPKPANSTPRALVRKFTEAYALAVPFLIILVAGNLRLLLEIPSEEARTTPFLFVFPLSALAAAGLIITGGIKAWHLGAFSRNGLLSDSTSDAWQILRRVEWILAGLLGGLALLSTVMAAIPYELLEAGRTFGLTTRGHTQLQFMLLLTLLPWLSMDKQVQRATQDYASHSATLDVLADPIVIGAWVALGIGALGAFVATWLITGPLWAWAMMLAPVVAYGWFKFSAVGAFWPSLLLAVVFWGIGNSITGSINLAEENSLTLFVAPGLLAMFRILSVLVLAVAVARVVHVNCHGISPPAAWPMVILIAATIGLVMFLELAFNAWILPQEQGEFVGIGSLVASQERAVRTTVHVTGSVLALASGMALARIFRPDWFRSKAAPMPQLVEQDVLEARAAKATGKEIPI